MCWLPRAARVPRDHHESWPASTSPTRSSRSLRCSGRRRCCSRSRGSPAPSTSARCAWWPWPPRHGGHRRHALRAHRALAGDLLPYRHGRAGAGRWASCSSSTRSAWCSASMPRRTRARPVSAANLATGREPTVRRRGRPAHPLSSSGFQAMLLPFVVSPIAIAADLEESILGRRLGRPVDRGRRIRTGRAGGPDLHLVLRSRHCCDACTRACSRCSPGCSACSSPRSASSVFVDGLIALGVLSGHGH